MSNGKAKGSGYERTICKMLTKWKSNKEKPYIWWRSPSSGALATITAQNPDLTGDIIAVLPEGHFLTDIFSIEIKAGYPNSSFHKFFKPVKNNEILQFWEQSLKDCKQSNKEPMVIYKKDRQIPLFFIREKIKNMLKMLENINYFLIKSGNEKICCMSMDEFFSIVNPDDIIKIKDNLTKWQK